MALNVERILDEGVNGQEPLREFASVGATTRAEDAAFQIAPLGGPIVSARALLVRSR